MGNCQALTKWPEEVMKILHVVLSVVAMILLVACTGLQYLTSDPYINIWHILLWIAYVCGAIVLLWFICGDPRKFKTALLIYYTVGCSVCFGGFIVGVVLLKGRGSCDGCCYGLLMCATIFSFLAYLSYIWSAYMNGIQGKP